MAERSFKEEVEKLKLGEGDEFHGEGILAAKDVDRAAYDVFHGEEGDAVGGGAAVKEAGDVRVVEISEDLALVAQSRGRFGRADPVRQHLDRNALRELRVVALGQVHRAHPALAEQSDQMKRTDPAPQLRLSRVAGE